MQCWAGLGILMFKSAHQRILGVIFRYSLSFSFIYLIVCHEDTVKTGETLSYLEEARNF